MAESTNEGFDFDRWRALAESDPDAFEAAREAAIREFIQQIPEDRRQRLLGLQWRIDTVRSRASNPTAAFLNLSEMMWDSFYRQRAMLQRLLGEAGEGSDPGAGILKDSSNIVPFRQIN